MDEFLILLQAKLDEAKSKGNVNTDIDKIQNQLDKIKIQAELDSKAAQKLADDIGKLINQKIVISNIGIDTNAGIKAGQEYGKQVSQGISQGMSSASKSTEKVLRDFSELNDAKRKFVDEHDLISKDDIADAERLYDTVRKAFSEFGQVTVSKGSMNDGSLENMRVKIEQVNGEMKNTRDFMLYFNESKNGFKLVDDDTIRTTEKMIQHLNEEKNIVNATNEEANAIKAKLAEQEKYYKNIKNEVNNLYSLKTKLLSADELQTAELEKQIKQTKERISYNNKQIDKKDLRDNSLDRQINDLEVAKQKQLNLASAKSQDTVNTKKLAQAERKATAALKERQAIEAQVNKIQLSMDNGHGASEYQNRINAVTASLEKYGVETKEAQNITASLQSTFDSMKGLSGQSLVTQADKLEEEFKAVKASVEQAKLSYDKLMQPASKEKISSTLLKVQKLLSNNTKVTEAVKNEWQGYVNRLSSGSDIAIKEINDINTRLKETESNMRSLGKLGLSWTDKLKQAWEKFGGWGFATGTMMTLFNQIRRIPQEVTKVNSSMVELNKVSDASASEVKKYFDEAADSAKEYGSAVSDMINATADWSRLGYSLPDSKKLAEIATLYTNVGDGIDMNTANEHLISTLQGFQLEAEDALGIIDRFNEVANNFPIDTAGIGEALQRSAASFYAANTDLSKSIALITGTNSVVQDPDSVGTMWKTVSMRLRGVTQELEEAGLETEGMVESTAQLRDLIQGLTGFDIMADEAGTQFKDIYDIVIGIGHEWKNLTDVEQAGLLEALAGKRQGNALSAALNNISMIEKAYKTAENSAGSALEEQEEYEKGIEYSLKRLEAIFQTFSNHILDSNFVKGIIDFSSNTVEVIDKITSKLGSLGTIGLGAGLFAGVKNAG